MQTIVSLVAAQMGVAIVPESMQNFQHRAVVYKPLQEISPIVSIALIWLHNPTPAVQRFLQTARDKSADLRFPIDGVDQI